MGTYEQGIKSQGPANKSVSDIVSAALTAAGFTTGSIADRTMAFFRSKGLKARGAIATGGLAFTYESVTSEDAIVLPLPTGMQDGDWTIVVASQITSTSSIGAAPAGWTQILAPTATVAANTSSTLAIYARKWVAGDAATVTISPSVLNASSRWACAAIKVRGADAAALLEVGPIVEDDGGTTGILESASITAPTSKVGLIVYYGRLSTNVFVTDGTWTVPAGGGKLVEANTRTNSSNPNLMICTVPLVPGVSSGILSAQPVIEGAGSAFAGGMIVSMALNPSTVGPDFHGSSTDDYFKNYLAIKPNPLIDPSKLV